MYWNNVIRSSLENHPAISTIRGRGLMLALGLQKPEMLMQAVAACREEGLLVDWFLFNNESIRLAPPLVISEDEVMQVCAKISKALDRLQVH